MRIKTDNIFSKASAHKIYLPCLLYREAIRVSKSKSRKNPEERKQEIQYRTEGFPDE